MLAVLAVALPASSTVVGRSGRAVPASVPSLRPSFGAGVATPVVLSLSAPSLTLSAPSLAPAPALVPAVAAAAAAAAPVAEFAVPNDAPAAPTREQAVSLFVAREVAGWDVRSAPADAPVPSSLAPAPKRSRLAKAALWTGAGALGLSALGAAPALAPAALVAAKGWLAWGGFSALAAARFMGPAADKSAAVPAPPAPAVGRFSEYRTGWRRVLHALDVQKTFEARVGDGDKASFSAWAFGAMRAGLYASGAALLAMLVGGAAAKAFSLGGIAVAAAVSSPAADASYAAVAAAPFLGQLTAFVAPALVLETVLLKVVFGAGRVALGKVLPPRAAAVIAGGLAVAGAVGAMSFLTTSLSVLLPVAALEAAIVWSYARSGSLGAALIARGLLTLLSLESARVSLWLSFGTAGTLAGLPAWTVAGVVALLLAGLGVLIARHGLAGGLAAPSRALGALGEWWRAPEADGRPKAFFPLFKIGVLWGLVTFTVGDLTYRAVHFFSPVAEAAPDILAKVLTGPLDIVLFNFVIVGFLEEFVFRRNLFKPMRDWLEKRRLSPRAVFWTAALASSLIFSYVHYIDFGALLAKIGIGAGGAAGAVGAYDWAWASFAARTTAGMVLAYQYWRSGLLLVPIVAHFASNTMEGLGLRWGVEAFLLMAAGVLLLQLVGRKPKPS